MALRSDFKSLETLLNRLDQFGSAFREYNYRDWPHLKNNEDFDKVYRLDWPIRSVLEDVYGDGRDLAVFMGYRLEAYNDPSAFPTLKRFVDSFDNGWLYQLDLLESSLQKARDAYGTLSDRIWAIDQMIRLYDRQISLLRDVKQTIDALKESDVYKFESGRGQMSFPVPEYARILECIDMIGHMFERLPSTYSSKDEEALRDHILVSLQAVVAGSATGETFNKRGKTDILVRNRDKSEFVGECKIWRGEASYLDAIRQLLGYLSWRDTKTAIILFIPNRNFSAIIKEIDRITEFHGNWLETLRPVNEAWRRFSLRQNEDVERVVQLSVMCFHIPLVDN